MRVYDAYVFDLYGTLADIRTDEDRPAIWRVLADELGQTDVEEVGRVFRRLCREEEHRADTVLAARGLPGPSEIEILNVFAELGRRYGVIWDRDALSRIAWAFRRGSTERLRLFDGARGLLNELRKRGHRVILLTNAQAAFTLPELELLGIRDAFDRIIISGEAGVRKPSPAFFSLLWQDGLTPERSLMIGNDDVCDCRGAACAGMDSLYIRTEQSPALSGPLPGNCREIASLDEVLDR